MIAVQTHKSTWIFFILAVMLSGWFTFTNLSEFITVGILQRTSSYPFGGEGSAPPYYQTAQMYATVNLVFGLLFLVTSVISCLAFLKSEKKFLVLMIAINLFFLFIELIMGEAT